MNRQVSLRLQAVDLLSLLMLPPGTMANPPSLSNASPTVLTQRQTLLVLEYIVCHIKGKAHPFILRNTRATIKYLN